MSYIRDTILFMLYIKKSVFDTMLPQKALLSVGSFIFYYLILSEIELEPIPANTA